MTKEAELSRLRLNMRTADVAIIGLDECFVSFDLVCAEFANDERTLCRKAISVKRNHTSNGFEVE